MFNLFNTLWQFFHWVATFFGNMFSSFRSLLTWVIGIFSFLQGLYDILPSFLMPIASAFMVSSILLFVLHLGGGHRE